MGGMINQTPETTPLQMYQVPQTVTPFSQSPNYFGAYTAPIQMGTMPTAPQYDKRGRLIKGSNTSSFENPSALPLYSMYVAPSSMPNINAYLQSPASLLGAMQSANVAPQGAGQYLTSNTSTGQ
jgi:hypothetical protein